MTGSTPFLIESSDYFKRSFKKLTKIHHGQFVEKIARVLEDYNLLRVNSPPLCDVKSRDE